MSPNFSRWSIQGMNLPFPLKTTKTPDKADETMTQDIGHQVAQNRDSSKINEASTHLSS